MPATKEYQFNLTFLHSAKKRSNSQSNNNSTTDTKNDPKLPFLEPLVRMVQNYYVKKEGQNQIPFPQARKQFLDYIKKNKTPAKDIPLELIVLVLRELWLNKEYEDFIALLSAFEVAKISFVDVVLQNFENDLENQNNIWGTLKVQKKEFSSKISISLDANNNGIAYYPLSTAKKANQNADEEMKLLEQVLNSIQTEQTELKKILQDLSKFIKQQEDSREFYKTVGETHDLSLNSALNGETTPLSLKQKISALNGETTPLTLKQKISELNSEAAYEVFIASDPTDQKKLFEAQKQEDKSNYLLNIFTGLPNASGIGIVRLELLSTLLSKFQYMYTILNEDQKNPEAIQENKTELEKSLMQKELVEKIISLSLTNIRDLMRDNKYDEQISWFFSVLKADVITNPTTTNRYLLVNPLVLLYCEFSPIEMQTLLGAAEAVAPQPGSNSLGKATLQNQDNENASNQTLIGFIKKLEKEKKTIKNSRNFLINLVTSDSKDQIKALINLLKNLSNLNSNNTNQTHQTQTNNVLITLEELFCVLGTYSKEIREIYRTPPGSSTNPLVQITAKTNLDSNSSGDNLYLIVNSLFQAGGSLEYDQELKENFEKAPGLQALLTPPTPAATTINSIIPADDTSNSQLGGSNNPNNLNPSSSNATTSSSVNTDEIIPQNSSTNKNTDHNTIKVTTVDDEDDVNNFDDGDSLVLNVSSSKAQNFPLSVPTSVSVEKNLLHPLSPTHNHNDDDQSFFSPVSQQKRLSKKVDEIAALIASQTNPGTVAFSISSASSTSSVPHTVIIPNGDNPNFQQELTTFLHRISPNISVSPLTLNSNNGNSAISNFQELPADDSLVGKEPQTQSQTLTSDQPSQSSASSTSSSRSTSPVPATKEQPQEQQQIPDLQLSTQSLTEAGNTTATETSASTDLPSSSNENPNATINTASAGTEGTENNSNLAEVTPQSTSTSNTNDVTASLTSATSEKPPAPDSQSSNASNDNNSGNLNNTTEAANTIQVPDEQNQPIPNTQISSESVSNQVSDNKENLSPVSNQETDSTQKGVPISTPEPVKDDPEQTNSANLNSPPPLVVEEKETPTNDQATEKLLNSSASSTASSRSASPVQQQKPQEQQQISEQQLSTQPLVAGAANTTATKASSSTTSPSSSDENLNTKISLATVTDKSKSNQTDGGEESKNNNPTKKIQRPALEETKKQNPNKNKAKKEKEQEEKPKSGGFFSTTWFKKSTSAAQPTNSNSTNSDSENPREKSDEKNPTQSSDNLSQTTSSTQNDPVNLNPSSSTNTTENSVTEKSAIMDPSNFGDIVEPEKNIDPSKSSNNNIPN